MEKTEVVEIKHEILLTTVDNPFNPFTQFREWYSYDCSNGYCTNALVDRIMQERNKDSEFNNLNEEQKDLLIIKSIAKLQPDLYKLVEHDTPIVRIAMDE